MEGTPRPSSYHIGAKGNGREARRESLVKCDGFCGEAIEIGSVYCIIAVCADEIVAEGVDDYEDDVHGEESVGL